MHDPHPLKIVVTGGAGFMGSHLVDLLLASHPEARIVVLDKMTYAATEQNLVAARETGRCDLEVGDIADFDTCREAVRGAALVFHGAAESHVEMSYGNPLLFTRTNAYGTHCLLEACRAERTPRLIHISTDEVYGPAESGAFEETAAFNPTNPYSASKAAAEVMAAAYRSSYGMDIRVVRGNNLYGTRQYPEKIIPRFITLLLQGQKLTIHGDGRHRRRYLDVEDFCRGVMAVAESGAPGGIYNIGTDDEHTNLEIARLVCNALGKDLGSSTVHTEDRPFNDRRYAIDTTRIEALGWRTEARLSQSLDRLVRWYTENWQSHWADLKVA